MTDRLRYRVPRRPPYIITRLHTAKQILRKRNTPPGPRSRTRDTGVKCRGEVGTKVSRGVCAGTSLLIKLCKHNPLNI